MPDPLDTLAATGLRLIWVEDFDGRILLADHDRIALIDHRITRDEAARSLCAALDLSAAPWTHRFGED